ncbi:cyclic-di-AMP receptor [Aerococcaceae bacterium WGS1372]
MKLVVAIVQNQDEAVLGNAFLEANIQATKLSSTGGFLKSGNTTFIVGVEDDNVDDVLDIIKECSQQREQVVAYPANLDMNLELSNSFPVKVEVGGAIVFVLPIDSFYRF